MRMRQEILLGIGGIRALERLGIQPTVCHMNEGHSAFMAWSASAPSWRHRMNFYEAREAVAAGSIFTTHTPVRRGTTASPPT